MMPSPLPDTRPPRGLPPGLWQEDIPVLEPEVEQMPDELPLPNPDESREPVHYCLH